MTDELPRRAWRSFVLTAQLLEAALDRQMQSEAGMPHAYYGVLIALYESEGGECRMGELAEQLRYSQSRLAHAVTSMEQSGWVERGRGVDDRRVITVRLTHEGLRVIRRVAPKQAREVRDALFSRLSAEELAAFDATCRVLLEALDER